MGAESAEALEVLRDVWRGQAQGAANLDDDCETHCRRMTDAGVGFDDYAAGDEADRSAAWRARLEREGKLVIYSRIARAFKINKKDSATERSRE